MNGADGLRNMSEIILGGKMMGKVRVVDVNVGIFEENDRIADETRAKNIKDKTLLLNIMASPGAGKTSVLLRTIEELKKAYKIGVMEADIEATVDAEKMQNAGVRSIQVHTGGECAMDASMVKQAIDSFDISDLDIVFLENVGNLVCPAEQDIGADLNVEILSFPEGDDKPLKYPLMFQVCQCVLINKIDTEKFFKFDKEAAVKRIHFLNPDAKIIFLSAKTGEGFFEWISWLKEQLQYRIF
jgi:hydrogenase nickel incorporation protein HypB